MATEAQAIHSGWYSDNKLGVSMAASWAWGASLVVGISVLLFKGFWAFLMWGGFNTAAIAAFAIGYEHLGFLRRASSYKAFNWPMVIVQLFAISMNLQAIWEIMGGVVAGKIGVPGFMSPEGAAIFVSILAMTIVVLIYIFGFHGSLISDQFQYWMQVIFLVLLFATGLYLNKGLTGNVHFESSLSDVMWGIWVGIGLVAGPFLDGMQWERIEKAENRVRVGLLGSAYFGFYLCLVACAALVLSDSYLIVALLFATSLMVDTSTLDSAASALQYLMRQNGLKGHVSKIVGAGFMTFAIFIMWPQLQSLGAVMIQTIYSSFRLFIFLGMLYWFGIHVPAKALKARKALASMKRPVRTSGR